MEGRKGKKLRWTLIGVIFISCLLFIEFSSIFSPNPGFLTAHLSVRNLFEGG